MLLGVDELQRCFAGMPRQVQPSLAFASSPEPPGLAGRSPLWLSHSGCSMQSQISSGRPAQTPTLSWPSKAEPQLFRVPWHQRLSGDSARVAGPDAGFAEQFEILSNQKSNSSYKYLQCENIVEIMVIYMQKITFGWLKN